ncbi:MAG: hypothetical protein F6K39_47010 [Okeania sp. SIO3B3]|nr:hypothetical protein [Okeania sp. SIO3B3]
MTPQWGSWDRGYGFGWDLSRRYDRKKVSHGGCIGGGGYNSMMIKFPEDDFLLIFLSNNSDTTALNTVSQSIEAILYQEEYVVPESSADFSVAPNILARYAGDYDINGVATISISLKDGKLYSTADDNRLHELIPLSKTEFYYKGHECVRCRFLKAGDGEYTLKFQSATQVFEGHSIQS